jgi:hypothetical protein
LLLREDDFRDDDLREDDDVREDDLRPEDVRDDDPLEDFFRDDLRGGTLAPFSRASFRPMAIACFRLFTLRPDPLLSVPFLRRCMADSTLFDAFLPYLAILATSGPAACKPRALPARVSSALAAPPSPAVAPARRAAAERLTGRGPVRNMPVLTSRCDHGRRIPRERMWESIRTTSGCPTRHSRR